MSLELMTLGVVLCIKSDLGSSAISALPLSCSLAGAEGVIPPMTIGGYTIIMNLIFVMAQVLILRRRFNPLQLFQLLIGFCFGWLLDLNTMLTSFFDLDSLIAKTLLLVAGCSVMGFGIALEVRCGSVTMPGEGLPVAVNKVTSIPFAKLKICMDTTLVIIAIITSFVFFGTWRIDIVGPGTLFAMVFVGYVIKLINPHLSWFDCLLSYRPGFRRYIFGLAKYIYRARN